jgi:hypothetical protein
MSLNLDLSTAEEQGTTIPDGTYSVVIEKAEVKLTKSGGTMISAQYKIKDGPHLNRNIFDIFNIENQNPMAVKIGLGQLKGMMKAFGHANPNKLQSTTELVGLKGMVTVKVEENEQWGPQVRVKGYKPMSLSTPVAETEKTKANPFQ